MRDYSSHSTRINDLYRAVTVNAEGKHSPCSSLNWLTYIKVLSHPLRRVGVSMHVHVFPHLLSCSFLQWKTEVRGLCVYFVVCACVFVVNSLSICECRSLTITWSCPSVMSLKSVGFRLLFIRHSLMWGMCGSCRKKNTRTETQTWRNTLEIVWITRHMRIRVT